MQICARVYKGSSESFPKSSLHSDLTHSSSESNMYTHQPDPTFSTRQIAGGNSRSNCHPVNSYLFSSLGHNGAWSHWKAITFAEYDVYLTHSCSIFERNSKHAFQGLNSLIDNGIISLTVNWVRDKETKLHLLATKKRENLGAKEQARMKMGN